MGSRKRTIRTEGSRPAHRLIVFEGVDGVGKSTLATALARYLAANFPQTPVSLGSFPGDVPGTLGEWVYRLHHGAISDLRPKSISPPAMQLLHVAVHIDGIQSWIEPALAQGTVILDRYWWSTYAYSRCDVSTDVAIALVLPEQLFWRALPPPIIFYVTRSMSLKSSEVDPRTHGLLDSYYREIIEREREAGVEVHELANDGLLDDCWRCLLHCLCLPYAPLSEHSM